MGPPALVHSTRACAQLHSDGGRTFIPHFAAPGREAWWGSLSYQVVEEKSGGVGVLHLFLQIQQLHHHTLVARAVREALLVIRHLPRAAPTTPLSRATAAVHAAAAGAPAVGACRNATPYGRCAPRGEAYTAR
jgi:hypothetical protein